MSQESGNKWVMPEPTFRHSTGELVKPAKPVEFEIEPDTLAPDSPDESVGAVDPDADTLVPDAPDVAEFEVDPDADTLIPNTSGEEELVADPEAEQLSPDISHEKSSDDPLAKLYSPPEHTIVEPAPDPTPAPPTPADVEPQPYVSEQFSAEKIVVETKPRPTKGSAGPMMIALGIIVLLFIAAGIFALVYYFLYMNRSDTGGF